MAITTVRLEGYLPNVKRSTATLPLLTTINGSRSVRTS